MLAKEDAVQHIIVSKDFGSGDKPVKSSTETPIKAAPSHHDAKPHGAAGKTNAPTMDETPHIHRFHRERVRKAKKHHTKLWLLTKILLVLCHVALLIIAYMHATH